MFNVDGPRQLMKLAVLEIKIKIKDMWKLKKIHGKIKMLCWHSYCLPSTS